MIVDSSALIAIALGEDAGPRMLEAITTGSRPRLSTATLVEVYVVMARREGEAGVARADALITRLGLRGEAVTLRHATIARSAFLRFGKGRHPAALNFGDCFSYALAAQRDEPLLFVGDDFARTDVRRALN